MVTKKKPAAKKPEPKPEPKEAPVPEEPKAPEGPPRASVVQTDPRTPYPTRDNPNPKPAP